MRSIGHSIGIPFFTTGGLPLVQFLLRYLEPRVGNRIYDLIGIYDAVESPTDTFDMNPDSLSDPDIELRIMDKSNLTIWSETDRNGNTIRDLPGYNALNPYEWDRNELTVDVFDTYLNLSYLARLFANFVGKAILAFYDRQLTCAQQYLVHQTMQTGNIWLFNRGYLSTCSIIKADGVIWGV